jgi:hypothetical protein
MVVSPAKWQAARVAVTQAGERFASMLESAQAPSAMATADWSIAETAAHVAAIAALYTSMVRPDATPDPLPGLRQQWLATTVDTVAELNRLALAEFTERDPRVLARRLRADIDHILRVTERADPAEPVPWLGDSRVPVMGVVAHLVNELLVHGRDIARTPGAAPARSGSARRARWSMPPQDIGLFFELFLVEVIHCGYGRLMDDAGPMPAHRIAVEFRSRYTVPFTLVLDGGRVSVEQPGRDIDVHVSFDPPALSLMLFGARISRPRALLTGKVVVWGRRPWLLPTFLRVVHLPS